MADRTAEPQTSAASPLDPFGIWEAWTRSFEVHAPLSGPVNQAIQAALLHNLGQLGLINITTTAAGDAGLERRIVEQVASYGRQLGWLTDAVDALVRRQEGDTPDADDQEAFAHVHRLRRDVEELKERAAVERIDRLVDDVRTLQREPVTNADALARLRSALAGD
jgi:hypothetical protein